MHRADSVANDGVLSSDLSHLTLRLTAAGEVWLEWLSDLITVSQSASVRRHRGVGVGRGEFDRNMRD